MPEEPKSCRSSEPGSGVIALSLASKFPEAKVTAIDVSDDALALARENAAEAGTERPCSVRAKATFLKAFPENSTVIVANLPYVSTRDRPSLSREVLSDPELAVFGGENGDELIRRLIDQAPEHLQPGGLLALEIGAGQSEAACRPACGKEFSRHSGEKGLFRYPPFPLCQVWIKFVFTAVIRSQVRSRSAGRKTRLSRSWRQRCSPASSARFVASRT